MLLTVLTLDEAPRLEWRRVLTGYYRQTGDWSVYTLFPCIIFAEGDYYDNFISIGNGTYTFSSVPQWNGSCAVLPVKTGPVPAYASSPGLFISKEKNTQYSFPEIKTTVDGIALIDSSENRFSVLRSRHLRRDIKL